MNTVSILSVKLDKKQRKQKFYSTVLRNKLVFTINYSITTIQPLVNRLRLLNSIIREICYFNSSDNVTRQQLNLQIRYVTSASVFSFSEGIYVEFQRFPYHQTIALVMI